VAKTRKPRKARGFITTIAGINGAIDLASIMVGVIVIGIIAGVIAATVFAVIPWAQDNAAKQSLDAVKTAQDAYIGLNTKALGESPMKTAAFVKSDATTGVQYGTLPQLQDQNLIQTSKTLLVNVGTTLDCYVAQSLSTTGNAFYASSVNTTITEVNPGGTAPTYPGCDAIVPTAPAGGGSTPGGGGSTVPVASDQAGFDTDVEASTAGNAFAISGYATLTGTVATRLSADGGNFYPNAGDNIDASYYDPSTSQFVHFATIVDDYATGDVDRDLNVNYDTSGVDSGQTFAEFNDNDTSSYSADELAGFANMAANGGSATFVNSTGAPAADITIVWQPSTGSNPVLGGSFPGGSGGSSGGGTGGGTPTGTCGTRGTSNVNGSNAQTSYVYTYVNDTGTGCSVSQSMDFAQNTTTMNLLGAPSAAGKYNGCNVDWVDGYPGCSPAFEPNNSADTAANEHWTMGGASILWYAKNGTDVTFSYNDAISGASDSFYTATENSNTPRSSYMLHAGTPDLDYTGNAQSDNTVMYEAPDFDSNLPAFNFNVQATWSDYTTGYHANTENSCLDDFLNNKTGQPQLLADGTPDPAGSLCPTKFYFGGAMAGTYAYDASIGDGFQNLANNGGTVSYTTTEGQHVTVDLAPGSFTF
jgi:type II secretory pathway pseudopilin PulG